MRPNQQNNNNNNNKNRSRGRNNGGRKHINPLSRNFESNGPDVKVRGNAAHIAEKYVQLARDAQSSGDSVMAENYLQHAEHYYRIVSAAQPQGLPRTDQSGQDYEGEEDEGEEVSYANSRFEPRFPVREQQPIHNNHVEAHEQAPQPMMAAAPEPEAVPVQAQAEPQDGMGDGQPRRARERRQRRRPRGNGEMGEGPADQNGAPDTGVADLPAFLTGGTAAAE